MKYFRWTHKSENSPGSILWTLSFDLENTLLWKLGEGKRVEGWDCSTFAYCSSGFEYTDFPFTIPEIPVYSAKLKQLMEKHVGDDVQFLPIQVKHKNSETLIPGYSIANYLRVIDCLDRSLSIYQVWTTENLLFWEKRPDMLGKFRDIRRPVLKVEKIGETQVFRLWGWESMVIISEDLKMKLEDSKITGGQFSELELVK